MTEIEKESEEYAKKYERYLKIANKIKDREDRSFIICFLISEGKKQGEKENEELKKAVTEFSSVIEKMKCCGNCKHNQNKLEDNEVCWNCERQCSKLGEEVIKDEWELAE